MVMNADESAVAAVLKDYESALNGSDTEAALKLYAPDGVFMPQHSPSSVGAAAVRKAYEAVFAAITLTVEFNIAEIRQIAPDWVLARTNSAGTTKNHATGVEGPEANQELFLFQKIGAAWKIARYCFCTTNPPRA
jgi:uncharacterized protein (TIGR02246 family)